jgi:hypothetical protein
MENHKPSEVPGCCTILSIEENLLIFLLNKNHKYDGMNTNSGGDTIRSKSPAGSKINVNDIFTK